MAAAIDRCVRGAGVSPGAAVVTFWFDVQADGDRARMGKRVSLEATTLASKDDDAFQGCLSTAHVGAGFVREGPPEPSEHVWPTILPVPVKNHELFRWLLSKEDG